MSIGLDNFYLIFAGALVFFMQLGFAMLCAGSIRSKNVKNVLVWNLMDSCGGTYIYIRARANGKYCAAYRNEDARHGMACDSPSIVSMHCVYMLILTQVSSLPLFIST